MEKIVKTRKPHKCDVCENGCDVGSQMWLTKQRVAVFKDGDDFKQTGIDYEWRESYLEAI